MENNFAKNLKFLRIQKKLTQEQLSKMLDRDYTTIGKWEKGERTPKLEEVVKVAQALDVPVYDLIGENLSLNNAAPQPVTEDGIKIAVYGTIKAGVPLESQEDIIDYINIPKSWTRGGRKFFALKIVGDSMVPKYFENDYVIFEKTNDINLYNGKDAAIMINHTESTFKKLLINDQGIVLQPYNTNYDIMMFSKEDVENLPIKVVGIAREKRTKVNEE